MMTTDNEDDDCDDDDDDDDDYFLFTFFHCSLYKERRYKGIMRIIFIWLKDNKVSL